MNKFASNMIVLVLLLSGLAACTNQNPEFTNQNGTTQSEDLDLGMPVPGEEGDILEMVEEISITETTWQWIRFEDTADVNNIIVADPSLFTLTLNADGSYDAKVDCNQVMGSFILENSSIKFEPGITTLAECGPESLYNTFLEQLGNVASYVFDGENLVLNLWADGGRMVFAPTE